MGRKLNPKAPTADIHWHPTTPEDVKLCRDMKETLIYRGLTIGDFLRPLLRKECRKLIVAKEAA